MFVTSAPILSTTPDPNAKAWSRHVPHNDDMYPVTSTASGAALASARLRANNTLMLLYRFVACGRSTRA